MKDALCAMAISESRNGGWAMCNTMGGGGTHLFFPNWIVTRYCSTVPAFPADSDFLASAASFAAAWSGRGAYAPRLPFRYAPKTSAKVSLTLKGGTNSTLELIISRSISPETSSTVLFMSET